MNISRIKFKLISTDDFNGDFINNDNNKHNFISEIKHTYYIGL
jgi:hypothetical protein